MNVETTPDNVFASRSPSKPAGFSSTSTSSSASSASSASASWRARPARALPPRAVIVTRPTTLEQLLAHHGTLAQARFFLEGRGQSLQPAQEQQALQDDAVHAVVAAIPLHWRRTRVGRADLDRFLFEDDDIIIAVGQDGLVANVAKYLCGQIVVGVNPSKKLYDGVLVRHSPQSVPGLLDALMAPEVQAGESALIEARTMVEARCSDGQRLLALNEIFIGHERHQSARYLLTVDDGGGRREERQSSSGIIVCSGTGATGWARSIARQRGQCCPLPSPSAPTLSFLVREPWPSVVTGADLTDGVIADTGGFRVRSEMNTGGVIFGDGIEGDAIAFPYGLEVTVTPATVPLRLC